MFNSKLGSFLEGAAVKTLTRVDATSKSNQHEIGTTASMRKEFLREEKTKFKVRYIWFDENDSAISCEGYATHYDTRANQPLRSPEWRLYYESNPVTELMNEGDTLFLAKLRNQDELLLIITNAASTHENQFLWLFGLQRPKDKFISNEFSGEGNFELDFAGRFILDELGIEYPEIESDEIDKLVEKFGFKFPSTAEFSALARTSLAIENIAENPDSVLLSWLDREEVMFRRLEKTIVESKLKSGFNIEGQADVDGFLKFSLSVQNRRKSRMGHSLEHHLEAIFQATGVHFERGAYTEGKQKPDFLLPSKQYYNEADLGDPILSMLASKSTCKDRWRQILPEADKIPKKHLATLEPSISVPQTDQMKTNNVQLVVPSGILKTYTPEQQEWVISLSNFIEQRLRLQPSF